MVSIESPGMVLKIEVWRVFFKMKAIEISFEFMKTMYFMEHSHMTSDVFRGIFDLPSYPNQILALLHKLELVSTNSNINLFSKIRCKMTLPI